MPPLPKRRTLNYQMILLRGPCSERRKAIAQRLCGKSVLDVPVSLATSPFAGIRHTMNNGDHRHEVGFLHEKDQVWEAIDLREAYR